MKTVINTRIDVQLKKQLQELADGMGLSLSSLVSVALTKVAREQRIELFVETPLSEEEIYENFKEVKSTDLPGGIVQRIEQSKKKKETDFLNI